MSNNHNYKNVTIALFCYKNDVNIKSNKSWLKEKIVIKTSLYLYMVVKFVIKLSYFKYCRKHKPHLEIRMQLKNNLQIDILYSHTMT